MTKPTLKLLESNYKTHRSLQQQGKAKDSTDAMEEDVQIGQLVEKVVSSEQWSGKRASKLSLDDFLQLLAEFNELGIHFS